MIIGRRFSFSAVTDDFQIGPVPEGRGEPSGLTMIPTTSFVEKSERASRFFVLNRSLRAASSRPSGTGDPFLFLSTGAEAPAYSRSASPRRARFYSSATRAAFQAEDEFFFDVLGDRVNPATGLLDDPTPPFKLYLSNENQLENGVDPFAPEAFEDRWYRRSCDSGKLDEH